MGPDLPHGVPDMWGGAASPGCVNGPAGGDSMGWLSRDVGARQSCHKRSRCGWSANLRINHWGLITLGVMPDLNARCLVLDPRRVLRLLHTTIFLKLTHGAECGIRGGTLGLSSALGTALQTLERVDTCAQTREGVGARLVTGVELGV